MESRLQQIRIAKPSSPVWLVTEAFVTKWNQRIPKIRRWQFMWNASNRRSSAFMRVHISQPYNSTLTHVSGAIANIQTFTFTVIRYPIRWSVCLLRLSVCLIHVNDTE